MTLLAWHFLPSNGKLAHGDERITVSICDIDDGCYICECTTIERALFVWNSIDYGFTLAGLIDLGFHW